MDPGIYLLRRYIKLAPKLYDRSLRAFTESADPLGSIGIKSHVTCSPNESCWGFLYQFFGWLVEFTIEADQHSIEAKPVVWNFAL